jgi:hypothetical protein
MKEESGVSLSELVYKLLNDAGFSEEDYVFIKRADRVYIEFNQKEAADYLIKISNTPEWSEYFVSSYAKLGERHQAILFLW